LNILSARVSPPPSPSPSRTNSFGNILETGTRVESRRGSREGIFNEKKEDLEDTPEAEYDSAEVANQESPLLEKESAAHTSTDSPGWSIIRRISSGLLDSIRWVLSALAAPGAYFIACLYDERGNFAPFSQLRKVFTGGPRRASTSQVLGMSSLEGETPVGGNTNGKPSGGRRASTRASKVAQSSSSSSGLSSGSESERSMSDVASGSSNRHTRSKSLQNSDEIAPARRSIRIKLHHEDSLRQRKHRRAQSTSTQSNGSGAISAGEISPANLKSPTSPSSSLLLTKYPRAPAPPRPLIPRRQPSYTMPDTPSQTQKTLILDLDETLIHSMAKGGRMGSGHMVEVKLSTYAGAGGSSVPILYYVHKRPYCDEFLRRVSISDMPSYSRLTFGFRSASGII